MASPRRRVVAIFVLVAAITQATNAGQYVTCRGKGFCGYQWNWGVRSRCFRCNRWINELPIPESRTDISTNPAKPSYAEANIEATLSKKYGEDSQVVQALRLAEKTHKAEKLESKPSWTQHKELSQSLAKRKKALDSVEKDIAYRKEQVAKLQKEIEEQECAKAGILVDIAALEKQVSVLAVRAAATPSGSGRPDPKGVLEALITTLPVQKKEPLSQMLNDFVAKFLEASQEMDEEAGADAEEVEETQDREPNNMEIDPPEARAAKAESPQEAEALLEEARALFSASTEQESDPDFKRKKDEFIAKMAERAAKRQKQG